MRFSVFAPILLALAWTASATGPAGAWGCCDRYPAYYLVPEPVYIYDPGAAPRWTSNGWSSPPVGFYPPPVPPSMYPGRAYSGHFYRYRRDGRPPVLLPYNQALPHW
jgi:hypothetical protein